MNTYEKLLNGLNNVPAITLEEKLVKQDGLNAMVDAIKKEGHKMEYRVGKGYKVILK